MQVADWIVLASFFLLLLVIGILAYRKVKNSKDFFTAGGRGESALRRENP